MSQWNKNELLEDDRHLLHPLQHPSDHENPTIFVKSDGAVVTDIDGREYIDGLSSLTTVGGDLSIYENAVLCQDWVDAFVAGCSVVGTVTTSGNGGTCP